MELSQARFLQYHITASSSYRILSIYALYAIQAGRIMLVSVMLWCFCLVPIGSKITNSCGAQLTYRCLTRGSSPIEKGVHEVLARTEVNDDSKVKWPPSFSLFLVVDTDGGHPVPTVVTATAGRFCHELCFGDHVLVNVQQIQYSRLRSSRAYAWESWLLEWRSKGLPKRSYWYKPVSIGIHIGGTIR